VHKYAPTTDAQTQPGPGPPENTTKHTGYTYPAPSGIYIHHTNPLESDSVKDAHPINRAKAGAI